MICYGAIQQYKIQQFTIMNCVDSTRIKIAYIYNFESITPYTRLLFLLPCCHLAQANNDLGSITLLKFSCLQLFTTSTL